MRPPPWCPPGGANLAETNGAADASSGDHVDEAPATVYATLLDEGVYLASVSTMCRLLREHDEHDEVGDRR